jgi:predicted RND superfamily exporter protein
MRSNIYSRIAPVVILLAGLAMPLLVHGVRGALRISNNDVRQWLPSGLRETEQYDWFLKQFGSEEMAIVSWPGATLDDSRLDRVTEGLQSYLGEKPADSMNESPKFFKRVTSTREAIAELTSPRTGLSRKQAVARLSGLLVGPDGSTGGVMVMVNDYGAKHRKAAIDAIYSVAQKHTGMSRDELHIGGPTVDSVALDSESQRSRYLLTGISVSLALFLAWRCLKQVRLVLVVFVTAILAATTSVAIVYYAGDTMNLLLVMMPTLVYLTAMSGAVHLVNYYRDALADGHTTDAPLVAVKMAIWPCFLCAATTAVGLGSLALSDVLPVRMFGTYSALGVMAALPILFLFLPSALQLWPLKVSQQEERQRQQEADATPAWTESLSTWIARHHAWVVGAGIAVMICTGFGLNRLDTSVKLLNLFSPQSQIIRDYTWLENNMGPLVPIEVVLGFKGDSKLSMLDRIEIVKQVEQKLGAIEKIGGTMSAATFAPTLPQGHSARQIVKRVIFDRRLNENREYFQNVHYLRETDEGELWRISARVEALNSLDYGYFVEQIKEQVQPLLAAAAQSGKGEIEATYTGIVPLVYKAQRTLLRDLMSSFLSAFLIIAAMMAVQLRSARAGLVAMIPNVFPAIIIFGSMGLAGMLCDIGSMMTAGVALGIAVDDTIHYLNWFRRGLDQGLSRYDAIVLAYRRCAVAMIQSSIICGLGLLVFSFSKFIPTSRFAWLMATMLAAALVGDLLLLPALLAGPLGRIFERRKVAKPMPVVEAISILPEPQLTAVG